MGELQAGCVCVIGSYWVAIVDNLSSGGELVHFDKAISAAGVKSGDIDGRTWRIMSPFPMAPFAQVT